ncbi:MAG TPA: ABC transporter substrate-binding protein [Solirubrobacteraceae bacterium]|nr:ABC transporter substrate-binding protein [Solirubrobacteraceae bacterium]
MRALALPRPRALSLCAVLGLFVVAGCSSQTNSAVSVTGSRLTIYGSLPSNSAGGQTATDVLDAEQLALRQNGTKVGNFTVTFAKVSGATVPDDARTAVQNQSAIAYLGEIEPGTSQDSVPITNELDLLQVSPTDTAAYLTQSTPAVKGAPGDYYPSSSTYQETFARVVPTTVQEAKAIVARMHSLHLSMLYVADDGGPYGASIAAEVRKDAPSEGLTVTASPSGADAVFYGGNSITAATAALDRAADASPAAKLFAPSALYSDTFVRGLSASAQRNLVVSTPGFSPSTLTTGGKQFEAAFASAFGHAPAPQAIFGYEAMSAVLAVLKEAGAKANDRATVVSDFRSLKNRQSVLGTYSISGGDTTIAPFVFGQVRNGVLVLSK